MIEHLAYDAHGFGIAGIWVPTCQGVRELAKRARRVALPVRSLECLGIKDGVYQIDLETAAVARVIRDFVLQKIPSEPHHFVVALVLLGMMPGEKLALRIQHGIMPGELRIDVILRRQCRRYHAGKNKYKAFHKMASTSPP